jgi:hypothetical protein
MIHYDHGMVGATVALAVGAHRRHGWPIVFLAALIGMFPDWDAVPRHVSPEIYRRGHRIWGHNIFAVTLAGAGLGWLGYWIHTSVARRRSSASFTPPGGPASWILLGLLIMWTHPLLDILYAGPESPSNWPVGLLWPITSVGFALPGMPNNDRGASILLAAGLLAGALMPRRSQRWACLGLILLPIYVGVRRALHG